MAERGMILSDASPEQPLHDSPSSYLQHDLDGLLEFPSELELSTAIPASGTARRPAAAPTLECVVRGSVLRDRAVVAGRRVLRRLGTYRTPARRCARTVGRHAWRGTATVGRAVVRIIARQSTQPLLGGSPLSFVGGMLVGTVSMLIIGILAGETPQLRSFEPAARAVESTAFAGPVASPSLLPASRLVSRQPMSPDNATSVEGPAALPWSGVVSAREPEAAPRPAVYRGSISIESQPQGGVVYLNNVPVGTTPLLLTRVEVGSRAIRIEKDGFQRWSGVVQIVAGGRARVAAELSVASLVP